MPKHRRSYNHSRETGWWEETQGADSGGAAQVGVALRGPVDSVNERGERGEGGDPRNKNSEN
jgi:hypothetical protein